MAEAKDYAYLNARVRAQRSLLLSPETILRLAGLPDVALALAELSGTPYGPEVSGLSAEDTPRRMDAAVQAHLRRIFARLRAWAKGRASAALALVLSKGDVADLKAVLRGKAGGRPASDIRAALTGYGNLPPEAWEELLVQPDLAGCVGALARWGPGWARSLEGALSSAEPGPDALLERLEEELDRAYRRDLLVGRGPGLRGSRGVLARFAGGLADLANFRALVRTHGHPADRSAARRLFVAGGRLSFDRFSSLLEGRGYEDLLRDTGTGSRRLGDLAGEVYTLLRERGRAAAERAIEREELRLARGLYLAPALSIGPVVGWMWEKRWEAQVVRLILRGKREGLPPDLLAAEVLGG